MHEITILNRILRWNSRGLEYDADPRHVGVFLKQMDMTECKVASTPGTEEEGQTKEDHDEKLSQEDSSSYRALIARQRARARQPEAKQRAPTCT